MSWAKLAPTVALLALVLSACGTSAKPVAGSQCLRTKHIPVTRFSHVWFQVGTRPSGPTVQFAPTPGAAQNLQITGQVSGAEVIGAALLYPNQATGTLLKKVETCVAKGVTG